VRFLGAGEQQGRPVQLLLQKRLVRFERAHQFLLHLKSGFQFPILDQYGHVRSRALAVCFNGFLTLSGKHSEEFSRIDLVTPIGLFLSANRPIFHGLGDSTFALAGFPSSPADGEVHRGS